MFCFVLTKTLSKREFLKYHPWRVLLVNQCLLREKGKLLISVKVPEKEENF